MQISFLTNVGENNLDYLKLLLRSLKDNLYYKNHEIIVFIDRDTEGIYEYLKSIKNQFYDLKIITHKFATKYVGYQLNINILVDCAKHDIVSYIQSDMIISKNYDLDIIKDLEDNCILSSTRVEPPLHPPSDKTFTMDFGVTPSKFKWHEFMKYAEQVKTKKTTEYFFAPFTFYKHVWQSVGGHDSIFRRSREDSDILQKFLHADVKIKQTYEAIVYHFSCVSSRGKDWFNKNNIEAIQKNELQQIADQLEIKKFIRKWGALNHGEKKLFKYDVDLSIKNSNQCQFIENIEPLFTRIWLDDKEQCERLIKKNSDFEETLANTLCKIEPADWNICKKYYNVTDYNSIFKFGIPDTYNCLISFDAANINHHELSTVINSLHELIENYDIGSYEYSGIFISILIKKRISDTFKITKNPQLDSNLISIE